MSSKGEVCEFVDPPDVQLPPKAKIWTQLLYCDMTGWYSLPENEKLELKPTRFEDNRLLFLDPIENTPDEIKKLVSGEYHIKTWEKDKCSISIEAEKSVYIRLPHISSVVTYHHSNRLPAFTVSWKPIVFIVNKTYSTIRLTEDTALTLSRESEDSQTVNVNQINYNDGFCCSHPTSNMAIVYGDYVVKHVPNLIEISHIESLKGKWGFNVQLYKWGGLVIPKELELAKPGSLVGTITGSAHKSDKIGTVFHPPNIFLHVHLDAPAKTTRHLVYGKDFVLTAKKESDTDINVYLLLDGQLAVYNYSFDIRINKPGGSKVNAQLKYKIFVEKEEKLKTNPKFVFKSTKEISIPIQSGSPNTELQYLISEQLVANFDAETFKYTTHPIGMKLCDAFKKLAIIQ